MKAFCLIGMTVMGKANFINECFHVMLHVLNRCDKRIRPFYECCSNLQHNIDSKLTQRLPKVLEGLPTTLYGKITKHKKSLHQIVQINIFCQCLVIECQGLPRLNFGSQWAVNNERTCRNYNCDLYYYHGGGQYSNSQCDQMLQ